MEWSLLGFKGLKQITNIHPAVLHFPIALYPATLLLYVSGYFGKKDDLLVGARICLYLASVSGLLTAWTGLKARDSIPFNEKIGRILKVHQLIGKTIGWSSGLLLVWSLARKGEMPRGHMAFLLLLGFTSYLVLQNADLGSRMVYVEGAGVQPATEAILA